MKYLLILVLAMCLTACGTPTEEGVLFKTADPSLTIGFRWLETLPGEVGLDEPDVIEIPTCEIIKGNISRDGRKLYHAPGMPNYNQVKINPDTGELFFCTEEEAVEAGWEKAGG